MAGFSFRDITVDPAAMLRSLPGLPAKAAVCWKAARPKTLPVSIAPVLAAVLLSSLYTGIDLLTAVLTGFSALSMQTAANLINDYMDFIKNRDTPGRLGPLRYTQSGLLKPEEIQLLAAGAVSAAALSGLVLVLTGGGLVILLTGIISILAAAGYSFFSRPLAVKGGGEAAAFIFFGPVACLGTFYLQTSSAEPEIVFASIAFGLYSLSLLTVNNYRDIVEDGKAGKNTLAVLYGRKPAMLFYSTMISGPIVSTLLFCVISGYPAYFMIPAASAIPGLFAFRTFRRTEPSRKLNKLLFITSLIMLLHAMLYMVPVFLYHYKGQ